MTIARKILVSTALGLCAIGVAAPANAADRQYQIVPLNCGFSDGSCRSVQPESACSVQL